MNRKKSDKRNVRSIKRKVGAGFTVLAFILFFSSIVSLFEYTRMNRVLTQQIEENVNSVNIARELIILTEDYNMGVLDAMSEPDFDGGFVTGGPANASNADFIKEFGQTMEDMRRSFTQMTTFKEKNYADSVLLAYTAYMQVLRESRDLDAEDADFQVRQDWYFDRLQPFYMKLRDYIRSLTNASQQALLENSQRVDETFYRSITPAIASVVVGLLVVILFNYFINFYLINPLIKINKGIQGYRNFRKDYTVAVDNNGDELDQLNSSVRDIIEDHKSVHKQS
ncbi:MAG: hypothetical protein IKN31_00405 [Bacteroidales bacterium]|nr:hypothetical protein [Bacteroidales bacterium]